MSILLIPIAPLSKTKSRLRDCFSKEQLKNLSIALFKDLCNTLLKVNCFDKKIVYCNSSEILELANDYNLIGIKEKLKNGQSFDEIISVLNHIAIKKFSAQSTVFVFLDLILISAKNYYEIDTLVKNNQLVVCPSIQSAGVSVLGRNPPDILPSYFSDPNTPSLFALINHAKKMGLKFAIYDSFRAGFDIDIKQDLVLAYEYLKIFNLKRTETFLFFKENLKLTLQKKSANNNREFEISKKN